MKLPIESIALLCAILLMRIAVPIMMKIARAYGIVDIPSDRRTHSKPTPRLGGLAINIVLIVTAFTFVAWTPSLEGYIAGLLVTLIVGAFDDFFQIRPGIKFIGQIVAATVFVLVSGVSITNFGDLFGQGDVVTGSWSIPLTVFAIVSVMNALNLIDGMNGLASGLSLIAGIFLLNYAINAGHSDVTVLLVLFIGCMVGYLFYNMYPARTFMGDAGSLSLGYALSTLSILLVYDGIATPNSISPISLALLLCLPIMDTLYVMLTRLSELRSPATPDNRHLHHVLLKLGFSRSATVSLIFLLMLTFCLASIWLQATPEWLQLAFGFIFASIILIGFTILSHKDIQLKDKLTPITLEIEPSDFSDGGAKKYVIRISGFLLFLALVTPTLVIATTHSPNLSFLAFLGLTFLCAYPWRESTIRKQWSLGIIYLAIAISVVVLIASGPDWITQYVTAGAILCIVALVFFNFIANNARVLSFSSFEVLVICMVVAAIIPYAKSAHEPDSTAIYIACLCGFGAATLSAKSYLELRLRNLNSISSWTAIALFSAGLISYMWT